MVVHVAMFFFTAKMNRVGIKTLLKLLPFGKKEKSLFNLV
jgi:hypothetical protein